MKTPKYLDYNISKTNMVHTNGQLEEERLARLLEIFNDIFRKKILISGTMGVQLDVLMIVPGTILKHLVREMMILGEQETYGVGGGTLVVNLTNPCESIINSGSIHLGRFPLDPDIASTFELHLTIQPSNQVKHKVANMVRRFQGKPVYLMVDYNFKLFKKKLYRYVIKYSKLEL